MGGRPTNASQAWMVRSRQTFASFRQPSTPAPPIAGSTAPAAVPEPEPAVVETADDDSSEDDTPLSKRRRGTAADEPVELVTPMQQPGRDSERIASLRELVKFLVRTRFLVEKQAGLAKALRVSSNTLSEFMTGRGPRSTDLTIQQLCARRHSIIRGLAAAGLPTELLSDEPMQPTSAETAPQTRASTAEQGTSCSRAVQGRAMRPPSKPLLAVSLSEVPGGQGGYCYLLSVGEPVPTDARWRIACPGSHGEMQLQVRLGMRGRRTFGPRAECAGRTFEWWVDTLDCPVSPSLHGGPLWLARELTGDLRELGAPIIGRARSADGKPTGESRPTLLWSAIAHHCGTAARLRYEVHSGFVHPDVQEFLGVIAATEAASIQAPTTYGTRKECSELAKCEGWLRELGQRAGESFLHAMDKLSPGQPEFAFEQLKWRPSWRKRFLPEEPQERDTMLATPFVATFVEVYHQLPTWQLKRQHLSMFAPHYPYKVTMQLFSVGRWIVYAAKLHASGLGGGARPVPRRVVTLRISADASDALIGFLNDPENVQILAESLFSTGAPSHGLKQVPAKLYKKYERVVPEDQRVGRSSFLEYLSSARCFHIMRA
eukprot:CAMPEP_0181189228 /NCGR_PEP_ID=MMETSP1096-20121128/11551_1 /TAXON_ID=156174 ORGANISM="Chrysochromulina ericina, Strain CCMP281" /NCGR_SAMPLE_ID=MMETSP1096 /ASSEMBLY_ACC=CAM_ASM_000453 /LENGTH=600 /DNA_ID=CAMNT_0023278369 /DNA_START=479 /DNA_END=2279 /DNA_ORIENTATION=-